MDGRAALEQAFAEAFPGVVPGEASLVIDEASIEALAGVIARFGAPDLEVVMVASEKLPPMSYAGPDGFRQAWSDWAGGFSGVRFQMEELLTGEDVLVALARQIGKTRYGVELEQPSAMVSRFGPDGRLARIEFHLDREYALRSAGLKPPGS